MVLTAGIVARAGRSVVSRSLLRAGIYVFAAISALALISPGVANAQSDYSEIVALAYDEIAGVLVKAEPNAVFLSADGGESWTRASVPLNAGASISTLSTSADGGAIWVAGPGVGVLRSNDGGASWEPRATGLPNADVVTLTSHSDQADTAYAYIPANGIYRTQDAGANWQLMDRGPADTNQLVHSNLAGSMETGWLYAATDHGVEISMDCFCLWRDAAVSNGEIVGVAYDRAGPDLVYAAAPEAIFRSVNGGLDWVKAEAPAGVLTAIAVTPLGLFAAADGRLFRSADEATTWEEVGG